MRAMKDSGLGYLGPIPAEWEMRRLRFLFDLSAVIGKPDELVLSLYRDYGVIPKDSRDDNHNVTSLDTSKYKFVEVGDFVINKMKAWQGSMALSGYQGIVSPAYHVFKFVGDDILPRYAHYLLRSTLYADEWRRLSTGLRVGQWDLHVPDFYNTWACLPPIDEQQRIADYLDDKCAEIDKAITTTDASIGEYKNYWQSMLYRSAFCGIDDHLELISGPVDYLDKVPASWRVVKGKNVLKMLQRPIRDDDGIITCFRDGEVTLRTNRRTDGFTVALQEIGYQGIEPGDLVVHGMDGFAGAIGVSDSRGKASPVLIVMDSEENKRFLMYYLRAIAYREVFLALADGIRVRSCNLSWKKLSNLVLVIPPAGQQAEIVDYLDRLSSQITGAIAIKQSIIDDLKAYKQSLIYEVVTGKREV